MRIDTGMIVTLIAAVALSACDDSGPADADGDTDQDVDADADWDLDRDVDRDVEPDGDPELDGDLDHDGDGDADQDGDPDTDSDVVAGAFELYWTSGHRLAEVYRLLIGDIDQDGTVDALVSAPLSGAINVFEGIDGARFEWQPDFRLLVEAPLGVAGGHFGSDADVDLVVAHGGEGSRAVTRHAGATGFSFAPPTILDSCAGPSAVAVGDVSCDGRPDVVVLCTIGGIVVEHLSDREGAPAPYGTEVAAVGDAPQSLAMGLLDDDGCADVVAVDAATGRVTLLLGSDAARAPALREAAGSPLEAGAGAAFAEVGDLTGDGVADIVVARPRDLTVAVYEGSGDGSFASDVAYSVHESVPFSLAVGDANGDSAPDLLVGTCGTACSGPGATDVFLLPGDEGGLGSARGLGLARLVDRQYFDLELLDLDGDSADELLVLAGKGRDQLFELYRRTPP